MTTTLTRPLKLELAEHSDVTTVARQHHEMWGSGLPKHLYYEFNHRQLAHPWGRRNYRIFVMRKDDQIVSSCKIYTLAFQAHSQQFRIAGIGAVFTPENARGKGYASKMMNLVVKQCEEENYDGVLLFSDIEPDFYEQFGFELMPDDDFHLWINTPEMEQFAITGVGLGRDAVSPEPVVKPLSVELIPAMLRHYQRYLQRQPYGIVRTESYLQFKIWRSLYRVDKVQDWPMMEVIDLDIESKHGGYVVFENSDKILRVLEVVGSEEAREALWMQVLRVALNRKLQLIRGWEPAAPPFRKHLRWTQRTDWSRPMLNPLNPEIGYWIDEDTCPLLELDHF